MLTYFSLRGRAEAIRLLLLDRNVAFEDRRVTTPSAWAELKRKLPFGALPHYCDKRVDLTQSHAILRYLARRHRLIDPESDAISVCDEAHEVLAEAQENLWAFAWKPDYVDDPSAYEQSVLRFYLGALGRWFEAHGDGEFWLADSMTHLDYLAFVYLDEVRAFFPAALAHRSALAGFHARMAARPAIAEYRESERRPVVFGMGLHGPKVDPEANLTPGQLFESPWSEPIELMREK